MKILLSSACLLCLLGSSLFSVEPAAKESPVPWAPGTHLQRTMGLLANSTPEKRFPVRVLYYGQSITQRGWTDLVTADLRARFPSAEILAENRAIGGFAADRLIRTTEADAVNFQPDLMIFHVYGNPTAYENLLRMVRTRTAAEVLVMTDHATWTPDPSFAYDSERVKQNAWGDRQVGWLRDLATREHLGYVDIRTGFRSYASEQKLRVESLTSDGTHLNAQGCALMARLVSAALVRDASRPTGVPDNAVQCLPLPSPASGHMEIPFANAVRLGLVFAADAPKSAAIQVKLDGKPATDLPALRHHGRTHVVQEEYSGEIPPIFQVSWKQPPAAQTWQLIFDQPLAPDGPYSFHVAGSLAGPDGKGRTDQEFISDSGQVWITPADWNLAYASWADHLKLDSGLTILWSTRVTARDEVVPPTVVPGLERAVDVAWDLPPGPHHLEITGTPAALASLEAVRTYAPAKPASPP